MANLSSRAGAAGGVASHAEREQLRRACRRVPALEGEILVDGLGGVPAVLPRIALILAEVFFETALLRADLRIRALAQSERARRFGADLRLTDIICG